jgi:hypothetical protein
MRFCSGRRVLTERETAGQTLGCSDREHRRAIPTHSASVSYQTQRQRVLSAGEIARLPDEHGLLWRAPIGGSCSRPAGTSANPGCGSPTHPKDPRFARSRSDLTA